jgi:hypothetical protein
MAVAEQKAKPATETRESATARTVGERLRVPAGRLATYRIPPPIMPDCKRPNLFGQSVVPQWRENDFEFLA